MSNDVREYYNAHIADEDRRLDAHPFEIPVMMHFIDRYLEPGDAILDVACGTGRIPKILLEKGFRMGLNDISDRNTALVRKRLDDHPDLLFVTRSDALETRDRWQEHAWNAILVLGPLYHMISKEKRLQMLQRAKELVKPGGYIFSAFMTRTGALVYGLKKNPSGILYKDGVRKLWNTGTDDRFVEATEWFTNAYFAHPEEVAPLIEEAGLEPLHLAGAEGVFGDRFELYHRLEPHLKKPWMDFILENCEDLHMIQNAKHLLSVARKPL